jgi:hypothetical protein
VMQSLQQRRGFRQWCALHRQLQEGSGWTCTTCTLRNSAAVLVCEACLTVKNKIWPAGW